MDSATLYCEGVVIRGVIECLLSICAMAEFGTFDTADVIGILYSTKLLRG